MGPRSRKTRANQKPMPNVNQMQECVSKTSRYCFYISFCFLSAYLEAVFIRVSKVIHVSPCNITLFAKKSRAILSSHHMQDQWCLARFSRSSCIGFSLHTAAEPAVQAAVKNQVSYRKDMKIAFFFALAKMKTMVKLLWPLLIINQRITGLI